MRMMLTNNPFITDPAVFAVGNDYQIMAVTNEELLFFVEVNGKRYYDHSNGVLRSKMRAHRVVIPMTEVDDARAYVVCFRRVHCRKGDFSETGEIERIEYAFRPVPKTGEICIYQISDAHQKPDLPQKSAMYYGKKLHLLIINGDTFDYCNTEEDFDYLYRLIADVTHGELPVVFAKGNHDNKGVVAEKLAEYTPVRDGKSYYTFRLGCIWGLVLDSGENCVDTSPEYGNTVCHHEFRQEETKYIKDVISRFVQEYAAEGIEYRMIVSHCAINNVRCKPFDIEVDIYQEWVNLINTYIRPDFMMSGHLHITTVCMPDDVLDTLGLNCPVIIGANPVGWQTGILTDFIGCAVSLQKDKVTVRFTDTQQKVVETHTFFKKF